MSNKPLFTSPDWTFETLEAAWEVIDDIAKNKFGLDYYNPQMEIVTYEEMLNNYSSIGMPAMYSHWSFGKRFIRDHQQYVSGKSGLAYEMIINTDPAIAYLMENNTMTMQALVMAHAVCVDQDTEVLTPYGWVKMSEYNQEPIAQYQDNGDIIFREPLKYIKVKHTSFYHLKARGVDQKVTADHTLIYRNESGTLIKQSAKDYVAQHLNKTRGHSGKFITHFKLGYTHLNNPNKNWVRLAVAIKADGSRHGNKYRFHLKKQRKIERLEWLLNSENIDYIKTQSYGGRVLITFPYHEVPKVFSWSYFFEPEDNKVVSEEVLLWDGCQTNQSFTTTLKQSADVIQAIWASQGYGTNITTYKAVKNKQEYYVVKRSKFNERSLSRSRGGNRNEIRKVKSHDGYAYCFTTDTGMWVSRRNDCIAVTGNCGHASFFKNNYLFQEWTQADSIVDYLVFAKNYIKECEYKYGCDEVELTLDAAHSLMDYGIDKYKRRTGIKKSEIARRKDEWIKTLSENIKADWDVKEVTKAIKEVDTVLKGLDDDRRILPEENLLYFLEKNSPGITEWQKEILRIVRKLAQYFYPQMQTKLMNEGWASFIHYHIMTELQEQGYITPGSYMEFLHSHTSVCCQHSYKHTVQFNPYALGFAMFRDIERICKEPTEEDYKWFPEFAGDKDWMKVCKNAMELYRDESFIQKFLSPKVIRDFKMFTILDDAELNYHQIDEVADDDDVLELRNRLAKHYNINDRLPQIEITGVDWEDTRTLELTYYSKDGKMLDRDSFKQTNEYLEYLWGYEVDWAVQDETGEYDEELSEAIQDILELLKP